MESSAIVYAVTVVVLLAVLSAIATWVGSNQANGKPRPQPTAFDRRVAAVAQSNMVASKEQRDAPQSSKRSSPNDLGLWDPRVLASGPCDDDQDPVLGKLGLEHGAVDAMDATFAPESYQLSEHEHATMQNIFDASPDKNPLELEGKELEDWQARQRRIRDPEYRRKLALPADGPMDRAKALKVLTRYRDMRRDGKIDSHTEIEEEQQAAYVLGTLRADGFADAYRLRATVARPIMEASASFGLQQPNGTLQYGQGFLMPRTADDFQPVPFNESSKRVEMAAAMLAQSS